MENNMSETAPEYTAKSPNIYQRIAAACNSIKTIVKTGTIKTTSRDYTVATASDVFTPVRNGINENGLAFTSKIKSYDIQKEQTVNSYGKEQHITRLTLMMEYTFINKDNPEEKIVIEWPVPCSDDGNEIHKLFGKALTYGLKYFFISFFILPRDDDDPDLGGDKGDGQQPDQNKKKVKQGNPPSSQPNPPPAAKPLPAETSAPNGYHQQKVTTPTPPTESARPANNPALVIPPGDDYEMRERERIKTEIKAYMTSKKIGLKVLQEVAKSLDINTQNPHEMTSTQLLNVFKGIKEGQEYIEKHPDEEAPLAEKQPAPVNATPSPEALKKN